MDATVEINERFRAALAKELRCRFDKLVGELAIGICRGLPREDLRAEVIGRIHDLASEVCQAVPDLSRSELVKLLTEIVDAGFARLAPRSDPPH